MFLGRKLPCPAFVCLVASTVVAPTAVLAAQWSPELKAESRYDDNVLRSSESLRDVVTAITPRLRLTSAQPLWNWELSARRTVASYGRDPNPLVIADRLAAVSLYQPSERETLFLDYRYDKALDPIEFETGLIQRRDSRRAHGQARLALDRVEAQFAARGWWYEEPELQDGVARTWGVRLLPLRTRSSSLSIAHRQQQLDLGMRSLTVDVTTVGARRQHARWLHSDVEIGRSETRFEDGSPSEIGPAVALGIWMQRGQRSDPIEGRIRIAHDVTTTLTASLERQWEAGHVRASVERLLDVEGGLYRNPAVVRRAVAEWQTTTLEGRTLTLRGTYGRVRPLRGAGTTANVLRATATMEFPLQRWLGLRTSYDFWRQDVPGEGLDVDFDRHRVAVALTASLGLR